MEIVRIFVNDTEVKDMKDTCIVGETLGWDLIDYIDDKIDIMSEENIDTMSFNYEGNDIELITDIIEE